VVGGSFDRDRQKNAAVASKLLARWIKHLAPPVTRVRPRSQIHVEDASHNHNYPRKIERRNYFFKRFFVPPIDLFKQPTRRNN